MRYAQHHWNKSHAKISDRTVSERELQLPSSIEGWRTSSTSWVRWKTDSKGLRSRSREMVTDLGWQAHPRTWYFRKECLWADFHPSLQVPLVQIYNEQTFRCLHNHLRIVTLLDGIEDLRWHLFPRRFASSRIAANRRKWSSSTSRVTTDLRRRTADLLWRDWSGLSTSSQVVVSWDVVAAVNWFTSGELLQQSQRSLWESPSETKNQFNVLGTFTFTDDTLTQL